MPFISSYRAPKMTHQPDIEIETTDESPKKKRYGHNLGLTKETNPKLSNRLPREKGAIVALAGDGLSPFERARKLLGTRFVDKKQVYVLDGRPSHTNAIMQAGLEVACVILRGRASLSPDTLDGRPSDPGSIMEAAEEFKWAVKVLGEDRVVLTLNQNFLDEKETTQKKIVKAAHQVVAEQRKVEVAERKAKKNS